MKQLALILLMSFVLAACDVQQPGASQAIAQPRYQLLASDGHVYRLDSVTGAVSLISPDGMSALAETPEDVPTLRVGTYHLMSDATSDPKYLKYLGKGSFERDTRPPLSSFYKK